MLLLGDLNINFGSPRSEREEIIVDLLNEIGLTNVSRTSNGGGMDDREAGDGLGGRGGGDSSTSLSQITAWLGIGMQCFFGTLRFGGLGSMTRITEPPLHQSRGDSRVS